MTKKLKKPKDARNTDQIGHRYAQYQDKLLAVLNNLNDIPRRAVVADVLEELYHPNDDGMWKMCQVWRLAASIKHIFHVERCSATMMGKPFVTVVVLLLADHQVTTRGKPTTLNVGIYPVGWVYLEDLPPFIRHVFSHNHKEVYGEPDEFGDWHWHLIQPDPGEVPSLEPSALLPP